MPKVVTGCRSYLWRKPEMTRVLLEHGMDPNLPDWQQATPLHTICTQDEFSGFHRKNEEEWFALLGLFLEFGADINAIDEEYRSMPLGCAARCGLRDMRKLLLKAAPIPTAPARHGRRRSHAREGVAPKRSWRVFASMELRDKFSTVLSL